MKKNMTEFSNQLKSNIEKIINDSYNKLANDQYNYYYFLKKDVDNWKQTILSEIIKAIDQFNVYLSNNLNRDIEKKGQNNNDKTVIKIESRSDLNHFTSKEIQEENKEITRNFQNEAYNHMSVNEKKENENVAVFLFRVAQIARIAHSKQKILFQFMKEKYLESNKIDINVFEKEKEKSLQEFSSFVKNSEKNKQTKEDYIKILSQVKLYEKDEKNNNKENEFITKLFFDLSILYFHCSISFPLVEISFTKKEDYNSEEMIDFINRGKNRKVNFVILPSLFSNGNFLQIGKSWVFTYLKNTFRFENLKDESFDMVIEEEDSNQKKEKKKAIPEVVVYSKTNYNETIINIKSDFTIPNDKGYDIKFYFRSKQGNQVINKVVETNNFRFSNNLVFLKYEVRKHKNVLFTSYFMQLKK